jgi:uncharacterized UPF0160 family protein
MLGRSLGTHDGAFHADEVTACALLLLFDCIDRDKIRRTRDPGVLKECEYVCDVGGIYDPERKFFDHHQSEYRDTMSSAGMVWRYLKDKGVVDKQTYDYLNRMLILGVDAHDNGLIEPHPGYCSFSDVIGNFEPIEYSATAEERDRAFFQAVDFVLNFLKRALERHRYIKECRKEVEKAMAKGGKYLEFDKAMPWMESFFELGGEQHPALFVLMPTGDHWKVRGIPPSSRARMQVRKPLPKEWAGLLEDQLKKVSGIEGALFCHKGRFISVWKTKEDAMKALKMALEES